MKGTTGNLIKMALNGQFDVIVHGCNCFGTMGAGLAKQIKKEFPEAFEADKYTCRGDRSKLGSYSWAKSKSGLIIVNAYIQYKYGTQRAQLDYHAIKKCMKEIKKDFSGERIGMPIIGCGLAGGDWNIVKEIIYRELDGEDVTIVYLPSNKTRG